MVGETLLRDLGIRDDEMARAEWRQSRVTPAGEDAWECTFRLDDACETVLVTVLRDPHSAQARALYAIHATGNDQMPRIPLPVRRAVESFIRQLDIHAV